jgi:hypothetical protein
MLQKSHLAAFAVDLASSSSLLSEIPPIPDAIATIRKYPHKYLPLLKINLVNLRLNHPQVPMFL